MKINFINSCICILVLISVFQQCCFKKHIQSIYPASFVRDSLIIGYENQVIDSNKLVKRQDTNLVVLSFFEEFDDTVTLYLNGIEKWRALIKGKNNQSGSTGYSGVDVGVSSTNKNNLIQIKLLDQKRFVEFLLDKEYPLCSIQRYNNIWHINYRKHLIQLK
jgi:hypothetical protein